MAELDSTSITLTSRPQPPAFGECSESASFGAKSASRLGLVGGAAAQSGPETKACSPGRAWTAGWKSFPMPVSMSQHGSSPSHRAAQDEARLRARQAKFGLNPGPGTCETHSPTRHGNPDAR